MRVVILADQRFASREHAMLARLQVGLTDESVRVVQALPAGVDPPSEGMFIETVSYEEAGLPLSLRWRAAATASTLTEPTKSGEQEPPRIVHAFGGTVWGFGLALAEKLDAALVLETWRSGLARAVQRIVAHAKGRVPILALCPDRGLAAQLREQAPGVSIQYSPWGVYANEPEQEVLKPGRPWAFMVAGTGIDREAFGAALGDR